MSLLLLGAGPSSPADDAPPPTPAIVAISIAADGVTWTLTGNTALFGHTGFVPGVTGPDGLATGTFTYVSGDGTTQLHFTADLVASAGTQYLSYTAGDVENEAGVPLPTITDQVVGSNGSTQVVPSVQSMTVGVDGTTWTAVYDQAVTGTATFAGLADADNVSLAYVSGTGSNTLVFTSGVYVVRTGQATTWTYTPGDVVGLSNGFAQAFISNASATNTSAVPIDPVADFTADDVTPEVGQSVQFTYTGTGGTATSWFWTFGDGGTSTLQNPTHTYVTASTFDVACQATNAGGSDTETKSGYVTASAPPAPTPSSASIYNDGFGNVILAVNFSVAVTLGGGSDPYGISLTDSTIGNNPINYLGGSGSTQLQFLLSLPPVGSNTVAASSSTINNGGTPLADFSGLAAFGP